MTATSSDIRIDAARLWSSLMEMAAIGATPAGGCDRQALTDADKAGRDLFIDWARAAGCTIAVDEVGNIFARRAGLNSDASPVLTGSHLDTQATGGKFDGVYGVLAGLEVVRTLNDHGVTTYRPIEVASWTNEEGCRFAPAMLGSGVFSGAYDVETAYATTDRDGRRFCAELERIGYRGETSARRRPYHAMLEAHIEQGPVLEAGGHAIGVVTGIQGAYWIDIVIEGQSCHAGPTPMDMRRDPWRVACPVVEYAFALAQRAAPWARATIGNICVEPGSRNTVPARVTLSIDLRHPEAVTLDAMVAELTQFAIDVGRRCDCAVTAEQIWHMPPTRFDDRLVEMVEAAATMLGHDAMRLVSGAGHDSLHTASVAPTAMIFVPCEGGLSHNEKEAANPSDLAAGADVLIQVLLATAQEEGI